MAKPVHVSIIMDGNGRWARERGLERVKGHLEGAESVRHIAEEAARQGVKYLSLFAFSEENWGRPADEVNALMKLMFKSVSDEIDTFRDNHIRFLVLGNRERIPSVLDSAIRSLEKMTEKYDTMTMVIFLSYSGKWDIFQAAKKMAADISAGKTVEMEDFQSYLVTRDIPDPDLIIRTSGEKRISNYLLWQGAYSEFYFTDVLWPDFREEEFVKAIEDYEKRDRRYGKVK